MKRISGNVPCLSSLISDSLEIGDMANKPNDLDVVFNVRRNPIRGAEAYNQHNDRTAPNIGMAIVQRAQVNSSIQFALQQAALCRLT